MHLEEREDYLKCLLLLLQKINETIKGQKKPNVKRKHDKVEEDDDALALFNTLSKEQKMDLFKPSTEYKTSFCPRS
jgi:hypothetical protein